VKGFGPDRHILTMLRHRHLAHNAAPALASEAGVALRSPERPARSCSPLTWSVGRWPLRRGRAGVGRGPPDPRHRRGHHLGAAGLAPSTRRPAAERGFGPADGVDGGVGGELGVGRAGGSPVSSVPKVESVGHRAGVPSGRRLVTASFSPLSRPSVRRAVLRVRLPGVRLSQGIRAPPRHIPSALPHNPYRQGETRTGPAVRIQYPDGRCFHSSEY
jgi:hypothetical protein